MRDMKIAASVDNTAAVREFVDEMLPADCSAKVRAHIGIVLDDLFSNIAFYAYGSGTGSAEIEADIDADGTLTVTLRDGGAAYNPLDAHDPDITLPAEERKIGGLGIFMAKKLTDEMSYERAGGKNVLRFKKRLR